jgi:hypothetical protein
MRHIIFCLPIILILSACSTTTVLEIPPQPIVTAAVETPTPLAQATRIVNTSTPVLSPTATETRTPFPTITLIVKTLEPSAVPTDLTGIWRVKHDVERDEWGFKSRLWTQDWQTLEGLPETVRINGGSGKVKLSPAWVEFLDKINMDEHAQRYLRRAQTGWVNFGPFPKIEQLTFGGNLVYVTRVKGHKAFIKTYNNADAPPRDVPDNLEIHTRIQAFSIVYTDGSWDMQTPVGPIYIVIIANPTDDPLWIDIDDLTRDPLPILPTASP